MVPGKKLTPDDFIVIANRYRWWILLPTIAISIVAAAVAWYLPNQYRSETVVLVVPQRVPETYVRATVTARISERVRTMREQILSRSRLERIVSEFNLYEEERKTTPIEDIVDEMRTRVTTRIVREDAFSVAFVAEDPIIAQKVTERLVSLFSEENTKDRESLAESTNQFLQTQLEEARQRLSQQERKVEAYRRQHTGELPEQVASNMQTIQNTELQIQSLLQSLNSDRDRRMLAERQLADARTSVALPPASGQAAAQGVPLSTAQQLENAEARVRDLETKFTPRHPDLVQARLTVERLEKKLEAERSAAAKNPDAVETRRASASESLRQSRINDLQQQIEAVDLQIAEKVQEEARLRGIVASYRARVEAAPARETDLLALTRDYQTLQQQYQNLLRNFEESKVAANLERRQIGEQLQILDPARVPERPFKPNRLLIAVAGFGVGLGLGLGLAMLLEWRDRTFHSPADIAACCQVPVLATLVTITPAEPRAGVRAWFRA